MRENGPVSEACMSEAHVATISEASGDRSTTGESDNWTF
jgi:hypothetical protein